MYRLFVCLCIGALLGCASCRSVKYDAQQDHTVLKAGKRSIAIPKRWKEVYYDREFRMHSFRDANGTTLTIYFFPANATTAYKKGSSDREFLDGYVASFTDGFGETEMTLDTLQDKRATDSYTLLRVQSRENAKENATVLMGMKRGMVYDFRCTPATWSQQELDAFLVKLFLEN